MNAHPGQILPALPEAVEAEQALLGAIFLDNAVYWRVAGFLKPLHFLDGDKGPNGIIYETIGTMIAEGRPVNPMTIKPYLPTGQMIGDQTFFQYVISLQSGAIGTSAAYDCARAVIETWARRQLIARLEDGIDAARHMPADSSPAKVLAEHVANLAYIRQSIAESREAVTMADAVDEAVTAIDAAYNFRRPAGMLTGVDAVDQLTGPWEPGHQIIIGGGTKQGKTALALQCAVGLAKHGTVWIYSGEMSVKQLAMREIARRTGIPVWRQKEGRISKQEWERLNAVKEEVQKLPILIEKRRMTLDQIHDIGRNLKAERGLASMVIDHVGLLAWDKDNARRDEWELSQRATQALKGIYEDLGIPGMSLVQLKKNTFVQHGRGNFSSRLREAIRTRPKYTDLMGAVERDADHVVIPFNARPILAGLEPEEGSDDHLLWEDRMREHATRAEIILALSREQAFPARRDVEWHGETTSFGPAFVGRQESLLEGM